MTQTEMTTWRPFERLFPELPRFFGELWKDEMLNRMFGPENGGKGWTPRVDLTETAEGYELKGELPGVKAEDIAITLTGDTLTIKGEKKTEAKKEEGNTRILERSYGSFARSFAFPAPVDPESVVAESKDGVLTVKVKKTAQEQAKTIKVKAAK
jgi:HSP20 family protein